ncbi:Arylsulfatase A [Bagarius yarrelli]|uniref:Arylsulfatase A n=1 Tax=Bagarius yarrelli TaxID=175774 RepID=A0A556TQH3_BAGYA|nr:Arylsulfatase A [Bagarius yarrelli]
MEVLMLGFALFSLCGAADLPNFVLLFADDLGYGDLGSSGHPTSLTPNLDRLVAHGLRFTDFYSTSPVCSPSRLGGLPLNETTIAEVLKPLGYTTAMIGKWHLGYGANGTYLPTRQGFDHYLGIPYSHDMGPCHNLTCFPPYVKCYGFCDVGTVTVPLMDGEAITQQPVDFIHLEDAYSTFATEFIRSAAQKRQPFFLYYPSHHTHYPQYAGWKSVGRSLRGPFGDALLEFDFTVGDILKTLKDTGVLSNTLVFFTADNGPELMRMSRGGNSGLLKCGKGTTYEGGMREPAFAYWSGVIKAGVTHSLASTLDILPTFAKLAGAPLPTVQLDGVDMIDILFNHGAGQRKAMFYYPVDPSEKFGVFAVRMGKYKAHYYTRGSAQSETTPDQDCRVISPLKYHDPPLLFDLESDPAENYNLSLKDHPELVSVLQDINNLKDEFQASMQFGQSEIGKGTDPNLAPCCKPHCSPKPECCQCGTAG